MAVIMKPSAQLVFFEKVLSSGIGAVPALARATALINAGYKFNNTLYEVFLSSPPFGPTHKPQNYALKLPVSIPTLMNIGKVPTSSEKVCIVKVRNWVEDVYIEAQAFGFISKVEVLDVVDSHAKKNLATPESFFKDQNGDGALASLGKTSIGKSVLLQHVADKQYFKNTDIKLPVPLRKATYLGQAVKGTGATSVYRLIGRANYGCNLAMKYEPGSQEVSFRLESVNAHLPSYIRDQIGKTLDWSGDSHTGDSHASVHLTIGDIPIDRVLGAVIYGLGLHFTEKIEAAYDVFNSTGKVINHDEQNYIQAEWKAKHPFTNKVVFSQDGGTLTTPVTSYGHYIDPDYLDTEGKTMATSESVGSAPDFEHSASVAEAVSSGDLPSIKPFTITGTLDNSVLDLTAINKLLHGTNDEDEA